MSEQEMTVTAYIGLGSNMGDERSNLAKALELLQAVPEWPWLKQLLIIAALLWVELTRTGTSTQLPR